jgi:hypothetical protein
MCACTRSKSSPDMASAVVGLYPEKRKSFDFLQALGRQAVSGRLRREQASGRRDQRPSARGPIRGTCVEACSKRQPRERLVRAAGFRHPSSLRLPEPSAGGLSSGPSAVAKKCCHARDGCYSCLSALPAPPL